MDGNSNTVQVREILTEWMKTCFTWFALRDTTNCGFQRQPSFYEACNAEDPAVPGALIPLPELMAIRLEEQLNRQQPDGFRITARVLKSVWSNPSQHSEFSKQIKETAKRVYREQIMADLWDDHSPRHAEAVIELQAIMEICLRRATYSPKSRVEIYPELLDLAIAAGLGELELIEKCWDEEVWPDILHDQELLSDPNLLISRMTAYTGDFARDQLKTEPRKHMTTTKRSGKAEPRRATRTERIAVLAIQKMSLDQLKADAEKKDATPGAILKYSNAVRDDTDVEGAVVSRGVMTDIIVNHVIPTGRAHPVGFLIFIMTTKMSEQGRSVDTSEEFAGIVDQWRNPSKLWELTWIFSNPKMGFGLDAQIVAQLFDSIENALARVRDEVNGRYVRDRLSDFIKYLIDTLRPAYRDNRTMRSDVDPSPE